MGILRIQLDEQGNDGYMRVSVRGAEEPNTSTGGVNLKKADAWKLANELSTALGNVLSVQGKRVPGRVTNRVDIFVRNN